MIDFAPLFAFCDLHASRVGGFWRLDDVMSDPAGFVVSMAGWPRYFDRQGFPIPGDGVRDPTLVWAEMHANREYASVAYDDLPDDSYLSTCWLGLDHGFGGPPLFFETMRFSHQTQESEMIVGATYHPEMEFPDPETGEMTTQLRYMNEEHALAAHHEIVRRVRVREGH